MDSLRLNIHPPISEDIIQKFPELHVAVVQILHNRGITDQKEIEAFLSPDYSSDQHDPFLFRDMKKVVDRIIQARDESESILVYGDYDADGVCSSVLLYTALKDAGVEKVRIYLPHRDTEGYGLNNDAIEKFATEDVDLIITVDCGISNKDEVQHATDLGMDVIVTDHHVEPPELPVAAYAIVNPHVAADNYPFTMLAGVGVAFKVAQALGKTLELGDGYEKWLLDLVAISTVTDCMPLTNENRTLVRYGLVVLNKTRRLGLRKLMEATHKSDSDATTTTIGYRIGPWINAAGRVAHANAAVDLLLVEDDEEAKKNVEKLEATNKERQALTQKIFTEAKQQAEEQTGNVIYVYAEDWPLGLVGLVAGKLVSAFTKPAFVLTKSNGEISGSGRSVQGVDMISLLQNMDELFDRYGGHAMACGFTLDKKATVEQFKERFTKDVESLMKDYDPTPILDIDVEMKICDVSWELLDQLNQLEPFGEGNPKPCFLIKGAIVKDHQTCGKTNNHLRLILECPESGQAMKAIAFGHGAFAEDLSNGDSITIICELNINEWNGNREIQIQVNNIQDHEPKSSS